MMLFADLEYGPLTDLRDPIKSIDESASSL